MADWAATLRGSRSAPGSRRPSADDGPRPSAAVHRREMSEMIAQIEERDRALEAKEQQISRLTARLDELSEPIGDLPAQPAPLSPGPPVLEELSQRVAQVEQEAELRTVEGDALRAELAEAQRELAEEEEAATAQITRVAALGEESAGQRVLIQHLESAALGSVPRAALTREREECTLARNAHAAAAEESEAASARLADAEQKIGTLREQANHQREKHTLAENAHAAAAERSEVVSARLVGVEHTIGTMRLQADHQREEELTQVGKLHDELRASAAELREAKAKQNELAAELRAQVLAASAALRDAAARKAELTQALARKDEQTQAMAAELLAGRTELRAATNANEEETGVLVAKLGVETAELREATLRSESGGASPTAPSRWVGGAPAPSPAVVGAAPSRRVEGADAPSPAVEREESKAAPSRGVESALALSTAVEGAERNSGALS